MLGGLLQIKLKKKQLKIGLKNNILHYVTLAYVSIHYVTIHYITLYYLKDIHIWNIMLNYKKYIVEPEENQNG